MLTRKHFNAIAQTIKETAGDCENSEISIAVNAVRAYIALDIASICAADNPNFNRDRFLIACDVAKA